jgi:hypothetical protein
LWNLAFGLVEQVAQELHACQPSFSISAEVLAQDDAEVGLAGVDEGAERQVLLVELERAELDGAVGVADEEGAQEEGRHGCRAA